MRTIIHRDRRYRSLNGYIYTLVIDGKYHVSSDRESILYSLEALKAHEETKHE
jgi:hypothetical protein